MKGVVGRGLSCLLALLALCYATMAHAERRVALVIGVSKYAQVPSLINPARDADAMSSMFRSAGFDNVVDERDLGIAGLRRVVREFAERARTADIAVVYYAGHGIEVDGTNYLVPTDARLTSDFDIEDETLSLDRVLKALDPAKRLRLVILDACRDNPFTRTMTRSTATRSIGRGLAKIEPTTTDTLIAFAARAGAVAADGEDGNSPFAKALVSHIAEPGLDLRIALGRVRDDVMRTTGNRQEPFVYGSLGGANTSLVPPAPKIADPNAEARVDFELAAQLGTRLAWEAFLRKYQTGLYADMARIQNRRLKDAEDARERAEIAQRDAERIAAEKTEELRKQTAALAVRKSETAPAETAISQPLVDSQRDLDAARLKLQASQREADAARAEVAEAKRTAAAEAQQKAKDDAVRAAPAPAEGVKLTALQPGNAPQSADAVKPAPTDTERLLQAHLRRVGCEPGSVDGKWSEQSRKALEQFRKRTDGRFDSRLASLDALDAVRSHSDRVCPLQCAAGQRADGERCVAIVCDPGFALTSKGACERRPERAAKPKTAARSKPSAPARSGGKCFVFNGRNYCE